MVEARRGGKKALISFTRKKSVDFVSRSCPARGKKKPRLRTRIWSPFLYMREKKKGSRQSAGGGLLSYLRTEFSVSGGKVGGKSAESKVSAF